MNGEHKTIEHLQQLEPYKVRTAILVFIIPFLSAFICLYYADIPESDVRSVISSLMAISVASFGVLVIFYTLIQTDEKRADEFVARCTFFVGLLFAGGIFFGVLPLINDELTVVNEIAVFFNVASLMSCVFVIIYYIGVVKVWHEDISP